MQMGQLSSSRGTGLNSSLATEQALRMMPEVADADSHASEQAQKSLTEAASKVEGAKTAEECQQIMLGQFIDMLDASRRQITQMRQGFSDLPADRRHAQQQISKSFCDVVKRTLEMTPNLYRVFSMKRAVAAKLKCLHEQLQSIPIPEEASANYVPDYLHVAKGEVVTLLQAIPPINDSEMKDLRDDYAKLILMLRDEMGTLEKLAEESKTERNHQWWKVAGAASLVVACVVGFLVCGGYAVGTLAGVTKAVSEAWALLSQASVAHAAGVKALAEAKAAVSWTYYLTIGIFKTPSEVLAAQAALLKLNTAWWTASNAFWGLVGCGVAKVGVPAAAAGVCVAQGIDKFSWAGDAERALKHCEAVEATALCLKGRYDLVTEGLFSIDQPFAGLEGSANTLLTIDAASKLMDGDHGIIRTGIDSMEWWKEIGSPAFRSAVDERLKDLDQLCIDTKRLSSMTQAHIRAWSSSGMDTRMAQRAPPADEVGCCQICMDQPADSAVLPCGHHCGCHNCLLEIVSQSAAPRCPVCRGPIASIARIYRN